MDYIFIINKFLNGDFIFKNIDNTNERFKKYQESLDYINKNNILKLDYSKILEIISNSPLKDEFIRIISNFKSELLVFGNIHGIDHVIRTSIFILVISICEELTIKEFKIVLESILYHDIGRVNDIDDDIHGYNSSLKVDFLNEIYNQEDFDFIRALITGHSLDDDKYIEVANKYNLTDKEKFYKLLSIVKDADSLDRVREYPYIDVKYLRTKTSKELLCFAYELFYNYKRM